VRLPVDRGHGADGRDGHGRGTDRGTAPDRGDPRRGLTVQPEGPARPGHGSQGRSTGALGSVAAMSETTLPSGTPAIVHLIEGASRGIVIIPDIWGLRQLYVDMVDDIAERTGC